MTKIIFVFLCLFINVFTVTAQQGQGSGIGRGSGTGSASTTIVSTAKTAPVKWERYKISGRNISLNLPKMPFKISHSSLCDNIERETFGAYAKQRAYVFEINYKSLKAFPDYCTEKREFSEQNFLGRKNELDKNNTAGATTEKIKYGKGEVYKYSTGNSVTWLIDDYNNKSWYEFSVIGANDAEAFEKFVNSLEIDSNKSAIEILEGAVSTIGDAVRASEEISPAETAPMVVFFKPRAKYSELARQNQTQGTVTLRVVFEGSGGIGSVTPVSTLPNGLTEEALSVAKKLIFKPAIKDGKPYTVTKQVQYNFTLY